MCFIWSCLCTIQASTHQNIKYYNPLRICSWLCTVRQVDGLFFLFRTPKSTKSKQRQYSRAVHGRGYWSSFQDNILECDVRFMHRIFASGFLYFVICILCYHNAKYLAEDNAFIFRCRFTTINVTKQQTLNTCSCCSDKCADQTLVPNTLV